MLTHYSIKTGDRSPSIAAVLTGDNNEPFDLSGATVEFRWKHVRPDIMPRPQGTGAAVILDAIAGAVRYDWAIGDTDVSGIYYAEWKITKNGLTTTFPNRRYLLLNIEESL